MSDNENQQTEASGLRKQLEEALAELRELKSEKRSNVMRDSLSQFGLDPDKGAGKLAAQAYDGDLTPDAVAAWLSDQGFEPAADTQQQDTAPQGAEQRVAQRQKLNDVQQASESGTDQKVTSQELLKIAGSDPARARQLMSAGAVELKHVNS